MGKGIHGRARQGRIRVLRGDPVSDLPSDEGLWQIYQSGKQTISELSELYGVSPSTIKRRLRSITIEWENPPLEGEGFVHIDVTYWGHNRGVILALDSQTGRVLYIPEEKELEKSP